ncbi:dephospho-CoA kinase [Agitococcus lubricus]|uniref:Dephospho-CoA kinase n=1 Tax=Agitococcus lubricus TaxID=1077255 RepID=A0A2T5J286_9GAMM|nr:dephospho-CoA kinase [Agitococcus lubricus]PTQ90646.1 dephospho-CoA kinase [Agitococcus lubricus]
MYVVGLTGGIGSGKTVASNYLATLGITVVDADIVAREVVMVGQPALAAIHAHFGDAVLQADGSLNRVYLRQLVFNDASQRQALEAITHPAIRQAIQQQLFASQSPYTLLVSPLLFESGQYQFTHRTLVIDSSENLQQERAAARDNVSPSQIAQIMSVQLGRAERCQRADDVVINNGDIQALYQQLQACHQRYLELSRQLG